MLRQSHIIMRGGKLERIPIDRIACACAACRSGQERAPEAIDLSLHWAAEQSAAMMTAPAEVRKETARLLTEMLTNLEVVRDAIKVIIDAGLLVDALEALEKLTHLIFAGADDAAPIVRTSFVTRRAEIARELHALLCRAYEKATGQRVEIERRA